MTAPLKSPVHTALLEHFDYLLNLVPLTTVDGLDRLLVACRSVPRCLLDLQLITAQEAKFLLDRMHLTFATNPRTLPEALQ